MFVTMIAAKIRAYLRYRETVRELSRLTDRELDDLGLSRSEINFIARVRGMVAFDSVDALIARMNDDVAQVRRLLT